MAACKCYIAMLKMGNHLQGLSIKKRKVTVEPIEDLEEISLDDDTPGRITHIGTQADPLVCEELTLFLKSNQDVFVWSHEDMLGISPSTMVQRLNVCPTVTLIQQKKKVLT